MLSAIIIFLYLISQATEATVLEALHIQSIECFECLPLQPSDRIVFAYFAQHKSHTMVLCTIPQMTMEARVRYTIPLPTVYSSYFITSYYLLESNSPQAPVRIHACIEWRAEVRRQQAMHATGRKKKEPPFLLGKGRPRPVYIWSYSNPSVTSTIVKKKKHVKELLCSAWKNVWKSSTVQPHVH
jgi:hypothetical protein